MYGNHHGLTFLENSYDRNSDWIPIANGGLGSAKGS